MIGNDDQCAFTNIVMAFAKARHHSILPPFTLIRVKCDAGEETDSGGNV